MKIRITEIDSKSIRSLEWVGLPEEGFGFGTLTIEFHSGKEYDYLDVPFGDIEKMIGSESFGFYLNNSIKPFYECREVTPIF